MHAPIIRMRRHPRQTRSPSEGLSREGWFEGHADRTKRGNENSQVWPWFSHAGRGQAGRHLQCHQTARPPLQWSCCMARWPVAKSDGRANRAAVSAPLCPRPSPCRLLWLRTHCPSAPRSPHPLVGHAQAALGRPFRPKRHSKETLGCPATLPV